MIRDCLDAQTENGKWFGCNDVTYWVGRMTFLRNKESYGRPGNMQQDKFFSGEIFGMQP